MCILLTVVFYMHINIFYERYKIYLPVEAMLKINIPDLKIIIYIFPQFIQMHIVTVLSAYCTKLGLTREICSGFS